MSYLSVFSRIKQLVSENKTEDAIKLLQQTIEDNETYNEIIIHSARLKYLRDEIRLGVIERDSARVDINRINLSILELVDKLDIGNKSLNFSKPYQITTDLLSIFFIIFCFILLFKISFYDFTSLKTSHVNPIRNVEGERSVKKRDLMNNSDLEIVDIIMKDTSIGILLDIKVFNSSKKPVVLSEIRYDIIECYSIMPVLLANSYIPPSAYYIEISDSIDVSEADLPVTYYQKISQFIKGDEPDRFIVRMPELSGCSLYKLNIAIVLNKKEITKFEVPLFIYGGSSEFEIFGNESFVKLDSMKKKLRKENVNFFQKIEKMHGIKNNYLLHLIKSSKKVID